MASLLHRKGRKPWAEKIYAYSQNATTGLRHQQDLTYTAGTPAASQPIVLNADGAVTGIPRVESVLFTEDGSGTSYTGTVAIAANTLVLDIKVRALALWDGTSASAIVGDTADPNGFFDSINLVATDLLVGETLSAMHSTLWGGQEGAYLVAASGLRNQLYYEAATDISMVVTPGAADGSAGRTLFTVEYVALSPTSSTNA